MLNELTIASSRHIIRFQQFAEPASDWLWEGNEHLTFTYLKANSEHLDCGGFNSIVGRNLFDFLDLDEEQQRVLASAVSDRIGTEVFEAMLIADKHSNTCYSVEVRGVPFYGSQDNLIGYRGTITDISTRKAAENRALYLSLYDELTGLPNRRAVANSMSSMTKSADRHSQSFVVAGIDLDGFKGINDVYGHLMGDALLKQVAERLQRFLRPNDKAYRTGGDEFVVALTVLDTERAGVV